MPAYNFRKTNKNETKKAIAYASSKGLGVVAMKTQAGVYWDRRSKDMINMKAALKWVLKDKNIHTSIPGFSNMDELSESFSVMENLTLTPAELQDLRISDSSADFGLFCQQCNRCVDQCSHHFNIPALMRSYMYAYGYRNPLRAKETLQSIELETVPCSDCRSCEVACTIGFDIRNKVLDIIRINEVPSEFLC